MDNIDNDDMEFLNDLLDSGIKPNSETLSRIALMGDVAVLLWRPTDQTRSAATSLGWDGESQAFRMGDGERARAIEVLRREGEPATSKWLKGSRPGLGRILVLNGDGCLCVNFRPGEGFSIEPGTLDCEKWS